MVPLATLAEARQDKKAAKEALEASKEQLKELQVFAAQAQPILQRIQADPALLAAVKAGKIETSAPKGVVDQAQVEMAKTLDLYNASGQPDIARAQKVLDLVQAQAKSTAAEEVRPYAERTAQGQSQANYERLKQMKLADGSIVDPEIFEHWWTSLGAEHTQDPNVANTALLQALGHQVLTGKPFAKAPMAAAQPALVTEDAGGRRTTTTMGEEQQRVARDLGVSENDFQQGIDKVRSNDGVLEP
jgi:hypothetical protein